MGGLLPVSDADETKRPWWSRLRVIRFVGDHEIGPSENQVEGLPSSLESLPTPTFWREQGVKLIGPAKTIGREEDEAAMLGSKRDGALRQQGDQLRLVAAQRVGKRRV